MFDHNQSPGRTHKDSEEKKRRKNVGTLLRYNDEQEQPTTWLCEPQAVFMYDNLVGIH